MNCTDILNENFKIKLLDNKYLKMGTEVLNKDEVLELAEELINNAQQLLYEARKMKN